MDWTKLITEILEKGEMTEQGVADAVGASQSQINRLKHGARKNAGFDLGQRLVRLHEQVVSGTAA